MFVYSGVFTASSPPIRGDRVSLSTTRCIVNAVESTGSISSLSMHRSTTPCIDQQVRVDGDNTTILLLFTFTKSLGILIHRVEFRMMVLNCVCTTQWSTTLGLLCFRLGLWTIFVVFNNCGHLISLASLLFSLDQHHGEILYMQDFSKFGFQQIWISANLDFGKFGFRQIWISANLDFGKFGFRQIWISANLDFGKFGFRQIGILVKIFGQIGFSKLVFLAKMFGQIGSANWYFW